jgi:glycosyltransferase involved in cell wall biosynthesis
MRVEVALARLSIRKADAVVVISRSLRDEMKRDGLWTNKCRVVLSGAAEPTTDSEAPPGLQVHKPFLLSLANDYPHKRLDDLVRAWGTLRRTDLPGLILAGSVSQRRIEHQRSLVPYERRPLLQHLGTVESRPQVRWLLENAIALVITSELEAFPLTPSEAGDAGCPLLLTDIAPHREVTEGRGYYFRVGRVDELATRLNDLLDNPPPRQRWRWPITWEENAEELATLLEEIAAQ